MYSSASCREVDTLSDIFTEDRSHNEAHLYKQKYPLSKHYFTRLSQIFYDAAGPIEIAGGLCSYQALTDEDHKDIPSYVVGRDKDFYIDAAELAKSVCTDIEQNFTSDMLPLAPKHYEALKSNLLTLAFEITQACVETYKDEPPRVHRHGHHIAQNIGSIAAVAYGRYLDAQNRPLARAKRTLSLFLRQRDL